MNTNCKCCGKPLEIAFAKTRFCGGCAVYHREVSQVIYRYQRIIRELERRLRLKEGGKEE